MILAAAQNAPLVETIVQFKPESPRKKRMNQETRIAVPGWYWVIAAVALLWNLMGCAAFATEIFAQEIAMESWTKAQKAWAQSIPGWVYCVYGLAVIAGLAGSVGLLMRRSWAVRLFAVSLAAVIVQMFYSMIIAGGLKVMGASAAIMPALVIVIAAALLWFSAVARRRGWFGQVSPTVDRA